MNTWGWIPKRPQGIWRYGAYWLRPFVAAAPWLTVLLLVGMIHLIGGTLTSAQGIVFDLPETCLSESDITGPVVLLMPNLQSGGTMVFIDDARYLLEDDNSTVALSDHFTALTTRMPDKDLLALADHRVSSGDLMKIAALARKSGIKRVLFAEKKPAKDE